MRGIKDQLKSRSFPGGFFFKLESVLRLLDHLDQAQVQPTLLVDFV